MIVVATFILLTGIVAVGMMLGGAIGYAVRTEIQRRRSE